MANIPNSSKDYSAVVVGLDEDLLAIKEKLCGETRSLQVIPIMGMGGIGKTTLARNAFHDPLIQESFHIGGWVTVSQSYNLEQILTTLKESLKPFEEPEQDFHPSVKKIRPEFEVWTLKSRPKKIRQTSVKSARAMRPKHLQHESQQEVVFEEETDEYAADCSKECTEPATATYEEHDETYEECCEYAAEEPEEVNETIPRFEDGQGSEEKELELNKILMPIKAKATRLKSAWQKSVLFAEFFNEHEEEGEVVDETKVFESHEEDYEEIFNEHEEEGEVVDETKVFQLSPESTGKPFDGRQLEEGHESEELIPKWRQMSRKQTSAKNARAILQKSQKGNLKQSLIKQLDAKGLEEGHESQKVVPGEEADEYRAEFFEECCEYAAEEPEEVNETIPQFEEGQGSEEKELELNKILMPIKPKATRLKSAWQKSVLFNAEFFNEHEEEGEVVDETKVFEQSPESTGDQVYKTLKGRKYLIVMDDIWSTEVCDHLKRIFPDDDNGSRVILTTRLQDVATYAEDCRPHEMRLMQEDQSWDLLRQKVGTCTHELEDIGKAIAKSCGGLPLAIVLIAGLLSTVDRTRASWEEIKGKVNSTVSAKDGQFEKILSFSYMDLPHHLRQCFVYMGGFPEDNEIPVPKLIKLWIAEGLIGAITAPKSLEDEAEECLEDLIKRSLVLVGTRKPQGEIKSCSLHDLMRDFCVRKAHDEKFPLHKSVDGTLVERLKAGCTEDVKYLRVMEVGKKVLNPFPGGPELYVWIPEQIFRLSNLRYLVLAYFVEIPAAVSYLENLQTLIIYAMESLVCLPIEIWTMPQLRHLISSFKPLPCPEGETTSNNLESLQTLSEVSNLECTNTLVEMIPHIKKLGLLYSGSYEFEQDYHLDNLLCLNQLGNLFNPTQDYDYHLENLERLLQLEKLKVRVYPGFQGILNPVFPQSLKKLSLSGWRLASWKDMTIAGSLPNLQVLKLRGLSGHDEKWETIEGEFPRLTFLLIERSNLREWITESEHFPNLKQLLLHYCCCLDEIPSEVGDILTLELIEVKEGNTSLVASARRIEEEQKEMGNESLQVRY